MAHLIRCWCGRKYRCEQDHTPPPGVRRFDVEPWHDNCPDYSFHGSQFEQQVFKTCTVPMFQNGKVIAVSIIPDIILNSVKDPLP